MLTKFLATRDAMIAESKAADPKRPNHNPNTVQLAERLGLTRERVRQLLQAAGLPSSKVSIVPARVDVTKLPKGHRGLERVVLENLRRLYKAELAAKEPRSDASLAVAAGFGGRPDQAAARFRKVIAGTANPPSLALLERLAAAFKVEPEELVRRCG